MLNIKSVLAAALASAAGLALPAAAVPAQATPLVRLDAAAASGANVQVDNVRWICGPYGDCRWAPNDHRRWGWDDDDDGPRWEGRRHSWRRSDDWW